MTSRYFTVFLCSVRAKLTCSKTLFIESWCDDERIIEENVRRVKISSPDVS